MRDWRWAGRSPVAAVMVLLLVGGTFLAQRAIASSAFDRLESARVAEDASRIRITLDYEVRLLKNYGATNSIWDSTFTDLLTGDRAAFAADLPPADAQVIFGLDGVVGIGPDGAVRVGGLAGDDDYRPLPADLADPALLSRMVDLGAEPGAGTCGVAASSLGPLIYCGFTSLRTDSSGPPAGGLIYFGLLSGPRLEALGKRMDLALEIVDRSGTGEGEGDATVLGSDLGDLRVATRTVDSDRIALTVALTTVTGSDLVLQAVQDRPIHRTAGGTVSKLFLITIAAGLVVGVAMMFMIRNGIKRQVGPLRRTAEAVIASGDRSLRVRPTGTGEIGALGRAIDTMLDALETRDLELERAATAREQQSRATAARRREAERQERRRTQNLVDDTISTVVGQLEEVVSHTGTVRGAAGSIDARVTSTSSVTRSVVDRAGQADQVVEEMADSLRRVDGIARLINEVAAQTKLLALNATIEAARAGAAGKGFNVVAAEVKALAATTAQSTEEITATIRTVEQRAAAMAAVIADMGTGIGDIEAATTEVTAVTQQQNRSVDELDRSVRAAIDRIRTMTNLSEQLERRVTPRVPVGASARVRRAGTDYAARVEDLSEGGLRLCFESEVPLRPGDPLDVHFTLDGQQLDVRGAVVHRTSDEGAVEIGVRLADPPADVVRRLRAGIATRLAGE